MRRLITPVMLLALGSLLGVTLTDGLAHEVARGTGVAGLIMSVVLLAQSLWRGRLWWGSCAALAAILSFIALVDGKIIT